MLFASLRQRGFDLEAIEKIGHDPAYPVTSNWPHLVQQLADFAGSKSAGADRPLFLVGHSLGGFLSLMCAVRHPTLAGKKIGGVVLLDAPVIAGWRATALSVAKKARLVGSLSPGAVSQKRRHEWLGKDEVFAHFRSKKIFAGWDEETLRNYIEHGTHEADAANDADHRRRLSFDRNIETAIYNTLPDNLDSLLRRHPPKCPVAFIGGRESKEIGQVGMAATEKVTHGRVMLLDGSHLFPMERPLATAAAVEAALLNMLA